LPRHPQAPRFISQALPEDAPGLRVVSQVHQPQSYDGPFFRPDNRRAYPASHSHCIAPNPADTIMDIEDFYNWEKMSISNIISLMVKWFDVESVKMEVNTANVESGVWWIIEFEKGNKKYFVTGQRTDIVRRRLIEQLDRLDIRKDYLNQQTP
jgi:hypothetical protein